MKATLVCLNYLSSIPLQEPSFKCVQPNSAIQTSNKGDGFKNMTSIFIELGTSQYRLIENNFRYLFYLFKRRPV